MPTEVVATPRAQQQQIAGLDRIHAKDMRKRSVADGALYGKRKTMTAPRSRARQPKQLDAGIFQAEISSFRLHLAKDATRIVGRRGSGRGGTGCFAVLGPQGVGQPFEVCHGHGERRVATSAKR